MIMVPDATTQSFDADLHDEVHGRARCRWRASTTRSRRILTQKFELGLFEHPYADRTNLGDDRLGRAPGASPAQAAAESQVLLKNDRQRAAAARRPPRSTWPAATPTTSATRPAAGPITWQGGSGNADHRARRSWTASSRSPRSAHVTYSQDASAPMAGYDVGVVVVGETPYAEGRRRRRRTVATTLRPVAHGRTEAARRQGVRRP